MDTVIRSHDLNAPVESFSVGRTRKDVSISRSHQKLLHCKSAVNAAYQMLP